MLNKEVWLKGEYLACQHLKKLGYKIISTNAHLAHVEVDIIAMQPKRLVLKELVAEYKAGNLLKESFLAAKKQAQNVLVFVEVKARSSKAFGLPIEAVTESKQMRIKRFAEVFVNNRDYANMPVRFDIVSILDGQIEHIPNAF